MSSFLPPCPPVHLSIFISSLLQLITTLNMICSNWSLYLNSYNIRGQRCLLLQSLSTPLIKPQFRIHFQVLCCLNSTMVSSIIFCASLYFLHFHFNVIEYFSNEIPELRVGGFKATIYWALLICKAGSWVLCTHSHLIHSTPNIWYRS